MRTLPLERDARKHGASRSPLQLADCRCCGWRHRSSQAAPPVRIVVLGDSLVAGFQLKASDAFPAQLERALKAKGHAVEIINAGVSGDTTAAGWSGCAGPCRSERMP